MLNDFARRLRLRSFALLAACLAPAAPVHSQVSHWPAEGNASDAIGSNHGFLFGTSGFTTGVSGQAFHFSDSPLGAYVAIPTNASLDFGLGDFSVAAWVRTTSFLPTAFDMILAKTSFGPDIQYALTYDAGFATTGRPSFQVSQSGNGAFVEGLCTIGDGNWHHLVGVRQGVEHRLYVDGAFAGYFTTLSPVWATSMNDVTIGGRQEQVNDPTFNGSIDEVKIWDTALGSAAILAEYLAISPATDPLSCTVNYCTSGSSASGCQASLSTVGYPSATLSSGFDLMATDVEGNKDGLFFFGANGAQANPWGNGTSYQCVVPPVKRCGLLAGAGAIGSCAGAFSQDLNALWCQTCPRPLLNPGSGATVQAQLWYRDPLNTSNQSTSLSDAVEFEVGY